MSQKKVIVSNYDSLWPERFVLEAMHIRHALGANCCDIHHIGSTSVPGLAAKPVIDIMPVVESIERVDSAEASLAAAGFLWRGENGMPMRRFLQKYSVGYNVHLHIFEKTSQEVERHLKFRNWMRNHAEDRKAYAALKQQLALRNPNDMALYIEGKEAFIHAIDRKAGWIGYRIVQAMSRQELEVAKDLQGKQQVQQVMSTENHRVLVLYFGADIIGSACVSFMPNAQAKVGTLVIAKSWRGRGAGSKLLALIEQWLRSLAIFHLQLEASGYDLDFYLKRGFSQQWPGTPLMPSPDYKQLRLQKSLLP